MKGPLVIANARVTPLRDGGPEATALAVCDGRIVEVGSTAEISQRYAGAEVIDAGGRRVIPGLIDSHLHLVRAGLTWHTEARWDGTRTLAAALDRVAARCATKPHGSWVRVMGGWHPRQFEEGRGPTRAELDAVAPDHPVYVQFLFEDAVLNTAAMRVIDDRPGAHVECDEVGRATGPAALRLLDAAVGTADLNAQVASTAAFLRELSAYGVTGASDMNGFGVTPAAYLPLATLWRRGEFPLRVRLHLGAGEPGGEVERYRQWNRFAHTSFGDGMLRMAGFGEIPSFGCTDLEGLDPSRLPTQQGRDVFAEVSRIAVEGGWPMHVHAILDSTASAVLDVWEKLAADVPLAGRRFALCHAESISAANIARVADLGVGIAVQGRLVLRGADSARAWGADVARAAPPLRDLLDAGIQIGAGTDGTIAASPNPWLSMWWLITGRALDGSAPRLARHRLTRFEALDAYTTGSAWFTFEDDHRGAIAPGLSADLAILSDDFFGVEDDTIPDIRSVLTIVGGQIVYREGH